MLTVIPGPGSKTIIGVMLQVDLVVRLEPDRQQWVFKQRLDRMELGWFGHAASGLFTSPSAEYAREPNQYRASAALKGNDAIFSRRSGARRDKRAS